MHSVVRFTGPSKYPIANLASIHWNVIISNPRTTHPTNPGPSTARVSLFPTHESKTIMTPSELKQWQSDLGLSDLAMAHYLGVPVYTWANWATGYRKPDAAPRRLFEVLRAIEANAPTMHRTLIGEAMAVPVPAARKMGRPPVLRLAHPVASGPQEPVQALPRWLTGTLG